MSEPIKPGLFVLDVVAENGVPFRVLAIASGTVGPNRHRVPAGRGYAVVEFYDRRFPIDGEHLGQFTGGYYHIDTILGRDADRHTDGGVDLHGGVTAWTVDFESMALVRSWLVHLENGGHL